MGAYSPAHLITDDLEAQIIKTIIEPTIAGMAAENCPFTGVLFAGIIVVNSKPILLEHNVRFGDPECQTLMMRFDGNLPEVLMAAAMGELAKVKKHVHWSPEPALCVVMAAKGYPEAYCKNTIIKGLDEAEKVTNVVIFHAGTEKGINGEILSAGGRVLGVCAKAKTLREAKEKAYNAIDKIIWSEGFYRHDIAWRALAAKKKNV